MTTKLEEAFNLRPLKEAEAARADSEEIDEKDAEKEQKKNSVTVEEAEQKSAELVTALTASEKVDHALTTVAGLDEHDEEMDEISKEALESYTELKELGMNMSDAHSGRIMEVAASMLGIALNARDAKVNRKLKMIELQLKKMRLDKESSGSNAETTEEGQIFDRNALLESLRSYRTSEAPKEDTGGR